ncbi:MAG: hypothetical protein OXU23_02000 [Candidatus Poribacteria bacterium]|nr:hypothetical protein [Candidatus Poribacteria bacterium]
MNDVVQEMDNQVQETISRTLTQLQTDVAKLQANVTDMKKDTDQISDMKKDIGRIEGKLEGSAATTHVVLTGISIFVAIAAVVVAIVT